MLFDIIQQSSLLYFLSLFSGMHIRFSFWFVVCEKKKATLSQLQIECKRYSLRALFPIQNLTGITLKQERAKTRKGPRRHIDMQIQEKMPTILHKICTKGCKKAKDINQFMRFLKNNVRMRFPNFKMLYWNGLLNHLPTSSIHRRRVFIRQVP